MRSVVVEPRHTTPQGIRSLCSLAALFSGVIPPLRKCRISSRNVGAEIQLAQAVNSSLVMSDSFDTNVSHFIRHASGPGEQSLRLLVFSHQFSNMESWAIGSRVTVHMPFAEKQHKPPNTTQWHPSDPRWQPLHCLQSRAQMLDLAEHPSFRPFIGLSMPMSIPSSGTGGYLMTSCTSGFDDDARIPRQVYVNGLQCLKELVAPTPFPASTVLPPGPDMPPPTATAQHHATPSHPLRLRTIVKTLQNAVNELVQPMPGSSRFHN
ncbi:hypothetical protein CABS03_05231 [Colletotrichum abscissum]|uniref:Uncharacterized protein n=1 Tax=Colletotrichum abscissum TaxID=1671311 RepID=A0A9Q0B9X6_9PEZI|nr:hypothetical protein CABS02_00464 [Colletotrichum abscissum]